MSIFYDVRYDVTFLNAVDGDTVDFRVEVGFDVSLLLRVRLDGLNAPETHVCSDAEKVIGMRSMKKVKSMLSSKTVKSVQARFSGKDKYGRYLAEVFIDDVSLNGFLVANGFAVLYDGGKRPDFFSA